jgi:FkbM family methyltransferase
MQRTLVYDVGLHKGEDTDFYLRMGYQVVAIEANGELVENATRRFEDAITRGKLRVIHGAVAPASMGNKVVFYKNRDQLAWSTVRPEWASRNENLGSPSEQSEVKRVDIAEVFRSHGIPFYLKIDVEGVDRVVLEALKMFKDRPHYISIESEKVDFDQLKVEMDLLRNLGYSKFKIVQQETIPGTRIRSQTIDGRPFEYVFESHASGPFGDDLPPPWLAYDEALEYHKAVFRRYKYFGDNSHVRKMPGKAQKIIHMLYRASTGYSGPLPGWFDTHASLG